MIGEFYGVNLAMIDQINAAEDALLMRRCGVILRPDPALWRKGRLDGSGRPGFFSWSD
ncbi:MAG: hypothetical protein R3C60_13375 [Parvularculaceae bacterium]